MSETTLDQIRHWRDRAVQGVVTPLTTVQIIRLCDAAERAETLEAQLTEVTRERDEARILALLAETFRDDAAKAAAALAQLRAVVEERMMKLSNWIRTPFNINPDDAIDECARLIANNAKTIALPADPSTPMPR